MGGKREVRMIEGKRMEHWRMIRGKTGSENGGGGGRSLKERGGRREKKRSNGGGWRRGEKGRRWR